MIPSSMSARLIGLATVLLLLVGVLAGPPALAKAACNNGGPDTDKKYESHASVDVPRN